MEGALEKRARSALRRWQKRWFKLINFKLSYFKFEQDISPRGTWDLRTLEKLSSPPLAPGRTSESSTLLNLHFNHRVHELRAPTVKSKRTWLMILQVFVDYHECPERPIPIPDVEHEAVISCFDVLIETGVKKKGIFRIPGENFKCKRVYRDLIFEGAASLKPTVEPHVIACVAKQLIRNLPETLLTNSLFDRFIRVEDAEELQVLIHYLPLKYKEILQRLCDVMVLVCKNEEYTKMDAKNLAVVVGPNLMKKNIDIDFADTSGLFTLMIQQNQYVFTEPEEDAIDRYPSVLDLLTQNETDSKEGGFGDFSWQRRDSDVSLSSISTASLSVCSLPPSFGTMSQYSLQSFSRRISGPEEHELDMARTRIAELEDEIGTLESRHRDQQISLNALKKDHDLTKAHVITLESGTSPAATKTHSDSFQAERISRLEAETELEGCKKRLKESQQKCAELRARLQLESPSPIARSRVPSNTKRSSPLKRPRINAKTYNNDSEFDDPVTPRTPDTPNTPVTPLSSLSTSTASPHISVERRTSLEMASLAKRLQIQFAEMQERAAKAEGATAAIEAELVDAISKLAKSEKETKTALQTVEQQQKTITDLNNELETSRARLNGDTETALQTGSSLATKVATCNSTVLNEKVVETNEKERRDAVC